MPSAFGRKGAPGIVTAFKPFSPKQMQALTWWCPGSPHSGKSGIICDGAVRSGKTLCMSLSFVSWAFYRFRDTAFALCGKTVASLRRNVLTPLTEQLTALGFTCTFKISRSELTVRRDGRENRFYLFCGRDESSAALIQGMTLGGVLLDEVALMPRSFVEQALARCSLEGATYWFNCNPEHPYHWFYKEWIQKAAEKQVLYLHFQMTDNPSLSPAVLRRYKRLYSGTFYRRFVEGRWVAADGLVYPMFDPKRHVGAPAAPAGPWYLSCDYGTVNPFSLGLWCRDGDAWCRVAEYYHSGRATGVQLTDEEYYAHLCELAGDRPIAALIIDPSAASFAETVLRHGRYPVLKADNDVVAGIHRVSRALQQAQIKIAPGCKDALREFSLYQWDNSLRRDAPKKENDHAMDDIRYFVSTVLNGEEPGGVCALAVERK